MRWVLLGDAQSPHLLKWARALAPQVDLWAASSRDFDPGFDSLIEPRKRLALKTHPRFEGGNVALLARLPQLRAWLQTVSPDWIHAHYLTSHGTLAWLARCMGVRSRLVGSAWGTDILVTPQRGKPWRWVTQKVLRDCVLTTSDSQHMAQRMRELGAREVLVFPFGLDVLPDILTQADKDPDLVFANRGLEDIYDPLRVVEVFARWAQRRPTLQLVLANDGSLRGLIQQHVDALNLRHRVQLVGRLDAQAQAAYYRRAAWYLSLPRSDSVSVSLIEALAHGCVPIVSDLPANREWVQSEMSGLILPCGGQVQQEQEESLWRRWHDVYEGNRQRVRAHGMFAPAVQHFLHTLAQR